MGNKRKLKNYKTSPLLLASLLLPLSLFLFYSNVKLHKKMSIIKIQFRPVRNQKLIYLHAIDKQQQNHVTCWAKNLVPIISYQKGKIKHQMHLVCIKVSFKVTSTCSVLYLPLSSVENKHFSRNALQKIEIFHRRPLCYLLLNMECQFEA